MSDWWKAVITTLSGLFSGFVLATANPWLADWVKRRQLHRALYIEMSANIGVLAAYGFLEGGREEYDNAVDMFGPLLHREAFEHALSQPDLFLRLRDAAIIRQVYEEMASLDDEVHGRNISAVLHDIADMMDDRALKARLMRKLVPVHLRANVVKLPEESRAWRRANARLKRERRSGRVDVENN